MLPAFVLGSYLLANPKGTPVHRLLGKIYMLLMLAAAATSLFMPAAVGPSVFGHFGFIHALSFLVLYTVPAAYITARAGKIKWHRFYMTSLYFGGILIAGAFAFMPGRMLNAWLFT